MRAELRGLVLGLLLGSVGAQAIDYRDSAGTASRPTESTTAEAEAWSLGEDEWARYETLMQGQRGRWSPGIDPITALGIHAETDAERQRYAERLVAIEFERAAQELAFERAYQAAATRLYPDAVRIRRNAP